jgi:hypothetical protein
LLSWELGRTRLIWEAVWLILLLIVFCRFEGLNIISIVRIPDLNTVQCVSFSIMFFFFVRL